MKMKMKMKKTACHMVLALASLSPLSSALAFESAFPDSQIQQKCGGCYAFEPVFPGGVPGGSLYILNPNQDVHMIYLGTYVPYRGPNLRVNAIDTSGRIIYKNTTWALVVGANAGTKVLRQGDIRPISRAFTRFGGELLLKIDTDSKSMPGTYGKSYYTGDWRRNPDNYPHAKVVYDYAGPGTALVGFEDQYGGGDRDHNDLVFLLTNVTHTPPSFYGWPSVPSDIRSIIPSWTPQ
jgi:hypothetical protein